VTSPSWRPPMTRKKTKAWYSVKWICWEAELDTSTLPVMLDHMWRQCFSLFASLLVYLYASEILGSHSFARKLQSAGMWHCVFWWGMSTLKRGRYVLPNVGGKFLSGCTTGPAEYWCLFAVYWTSLSVAQS
jgi:hypothetical protein